jgi:hypothetical protein
MQKKNRGFAADKTVRDASSRKLLHKLEARARLMSLADQSRFADLPPEHREKLRLREYLLEWKAYLESYRPRLGAPDSANFLVGADRGVSTASEWLERSDRWAMEIIERSIDDLRKRTDGEAMRAALLVRLLNVSIPAKVFRHGRLQKLTPEEVESMADRAEEAMVAIVKLYGLPLQI